MPYIPGRRMIAEMETVGIETVSSSHTIHRRKTWRHSFGLHMT